MSMLSKATTPINLHISINHVIMFQAYEMYAYNFLFIIIILRSSFHFIWQGSHFRSEPTVFDFRVSCFPTLGLLVRTPAALLRVCMNVEVTHVHFVAGVSSPFSIYHLIFNLRNGTNHEDSLVWDQKPLVENENTFLIRGRNICYEIIGEDGLLLPEA